MTVQNVFILKYRADKIPRFRKISRLFSIIVRFTPLFITNYLDFLQHSGQSICFRQELLMKDALSYYLDNSPTIGYLNDESGILGGIKIKITDNRNIPISGVDVRLYFHKTAGWLTLQSDSLGQISDSLVSYLWPIKVVKYSYKTQTFTQQIWPDSTIELNIVLQPDPEYYQSYFPLQVGNSWTYTPSSGSQFTNTIDDTLIIDGQRYYILASSYFRFDSLGNVIGYIEGKDTLKYPLVLPMNDSLIIGDSTAELYEILKVYKNNSEISVPAGKFNDVLNINIHPSTCPSMCDGTMLYCFAKDVGLIYFNIVGGGFYEYSLTSAIVNGVTYPTSGIQPIPGQPEKYALKLNNYPNPFNSSTTLKYHLPETGDVRLSVFDLSGRLVEELFSGRQSAGDYHYIWSGKNLPSGIYFLNLQAGDQKIVQKCLLMK